MQSPLQLASYLHPNIEIPPFRGRVGLLDVIRPQDQVSGLQQYFAHVRILLQLGSHRRHDQPVMRPSLLRAVRHSPAFKGHPVDAHLLHVRLGQSPGVLGLERSHARHLAAGVRPHDTASLRARIAWAFGIEHHLPEPFDTGVALAVKGEWRSREVREDSQLVAFGKDHLAGLGRLRQDLPARLAILGNRRPPMGGIRPGAHNLASGGDD